MMRTVTFNTQVQDGIIRIPTKYKSLESRDIRVVLILPTDDVSPTGTEKQKTKARGILRANNNPDLIAEEKSAWETAVKEKHDY